MKTLVIGASENTERYSNKAIRRLLQFGHEVLAYSNRPGNVGGVEFKTDFESFSKVHTVTMYLNEVNQEFVIKDILALYPKRIIFNPGAENQKLMNLAQKNNIETIEACTLVMLSTGQY